MSSTPAADGVLVVDKHEGPTSHDVVAVARRALGESRIGHTGTLDPMATGVLPLVIGRATRLAQYLAASRKTYDATIRFGLTTDTYDRAGTVVARSDRRPARGELDAALGSFTGSFTQTPPAFSAKSLDGTRAYERARRHGPGAVQPRPVRVRVDRLEVLSFDGEVARLVVEAAAGFYVRSLAHDLGTAVGTGAVLDVLRRTQSGGFGLEGSTPYDNLVTLGRDALVSRVIPFDRLLSDRPAVTLDARSVDRVRHGLDVGPFPLESVIAAAKGGNAETDAADDILRLLDSEGRLVALGKASGLPGFLHAPVVFG
jgi:tRNA pseudouridine55 synthase